MPWRESYRNARSGYACGLARLTEKVDAPIQGDGRMPGSAGRRGAPDALARWPAACFFQGRVKSAHVLEALMRKLGMTLSVAGLALLGACSRGSDARSDDALKNDLALAAQAQPYQAQQFVSPMEAQYGSPYGAQQYNASARSPYYTPAPVYSPAPVYRAPARTTTARRSSSGSQGTYYPAPAREPVRHTKRDAAIGAAAGAVIGAVSSRDKVKGGLIGAAAGGILGGIIGHTVDVEK
jgi:hypothetical protein